MSCLSLFIAFGVAVLCSASGMAAVCQNNMKSQDFEREGSEDFHSEQGKAVEKPDLNKSLEEYPTHSKNHSSCCFSNPSFGFLSSESAGVFGEEHAQDREKTTNSERNEPEIRISMPLAAASSVVFCQLISSQPKQKMARRWKSIQHEKAMVLVNKEKIVVPIKSSFHPVEIDTGGMLWEVAGLRTSSLGEIVAEIFLAHHIGKPLMTLIEDDQNIEYVLLISEKGEVCLSQLYEKIKDNITGQEGEVGIGISSELCASIRVCYVDL